MTGTDNDDDMIKRISAMIIKDRKGQLSDQQRIELQEWIALSPSNRDWYAYMCDDENTVTDFLTYQMAVSKKAAARVKIDRQLKERAGEGKSNQLGFMRSPFFRMVAAAVILFSLVIGGFFFLNSKRDGHAVEVSSHLNKNDVAPGGNKAVLTLADGKTIVLDSAGNGTLAQQGNTRVSKLDSGVIAYNKTGGGSKEVLYNTISTPRGGQYKIILPDGSVVWLNAASTLRFPTTFTKSGRSVDLLIGEAYFEIIHRAAEPFTVRIPAPQPAEPGLVVEALGTSFDINAYPDEPDMKATLLTGSVKVSKGKQTVLLRPGQQAQTQDQLKTIIVKTDVDASGTVAWKDGLFKFDRAGTEAVMRQLARWYDVEVSYEGNIPARQFVGTIPRNVPASDVLKALELNSVHFRIEGKKIIVMP